MIIAFIGEASTEQANQLTILKGCSMMEVIGKHQITKEIVLRAIETLNEETKTKLKHWNKVTSFEAKNPGMTYPGCAPPHAGRAPARGARATHAAP